MHDGGIGCAWRRHMVEVKETHGEDLWQGGGKCTEKVETHVKQDESLRFDGGDALGR